MRKRTVFCLIVCGLGFALSSFPVARPHAQEPVSFAKDIKPIFEKSCWGCHSGATQLSKLDLSTRDGALKGGEHGPAIVPGKADDSRLYRLVAGVEKPGMPLDGRTLSEEQIAVIKTWIEQGA